MQNKETEIIERKKVISKKIKYNSGIFLTMFGLMTIVLLSFYPGIITVDGKNQWEQILTGNIINNHPYFSTFFWSLLAKIWKEPTCLMVFQIGLISAIWTYICSELRTEKNFTKQILYTIVICFIPIIFIYTITAWKDIIYSYMLILLALMFYVGIKKDFKYSIKNLIIISICLTGIALYRYNGIIAMVLSFITLIIIFIKNKIGYKKILTFILSFVIIFSVCKLPEKLFLKPIYNTSSNDIMFFVLASLVKDDKIDEKSDLDLINEIYPINKIKENYDPYVVNPLAFSTDYNREIYAKHNKEIKDILIKYAIKHPFTIIKHYLQSDNLLIGVTFGGDLGYVYVFDFDNWFTKYSGDFNIKTQSLIELGYKFYLKLINTSTKLEVLKLFYLPGVILYLTIILTIIYCKKNKSKKYFLILLPMIYNTCSLLPINVAQDLRYVYINYLTLILLIIPLYIFKQRKVIEKEKYKEINGGKSLVIIPAYNESESIEKVVNSVYKQNIENLDVVVVNDGSKDNTYEVAKRTKAIVLDLPSNLGIGGAVQSGYLYAYKNNYDYAIQIDGDGQHNPKYLIDMINILKKNNIDMVIGSRFIEKTAYNQTFMRMFGINIISLIIKLFTHEKIFDTTSGYRAVNRRIIEEFSKEYPYDYPEPVTTMQVILKGMKVKEVSVIMEKRTTGVSSISPLKSVSYMLKVCLALVLNRFRKY